MPESLWVLLITANIDGLIVEEITVFENYGEVMPLVRLAKRKGLEVNFWNLYGTQKPSKRAALEGEK